jgi:hypothetical protein
MLVDFVMCALSELFSFTKYMASVAWPPVTG